MKENNTEKSIKLSIKYDIDGVLSYAFILSILKIFNDITWTWKDIGSFLLLCVVLEVTFKFLAEWMNQKSKRRKERRGHGM